VQPRTEKSILVYVYSEKQALRFVHTAVALRVIPCGAVQSCAARHRTKTSDRNAPRPMWTNRESLFTAS